MGNLIKKPSELEAKSTISMLIYGQPGVGKSTLGCSAPNAVLFDFDGGVNRINGAHQVPAVQIKSWEDTAAALQEIAQGEADSSLKVDTIVIDTVGKMLDFMSASIIRQDSRLGQRDGSLSLKGYGVRKGMFIAFIKQLATEGKNVIFIAHEKEEKQGEFTVKRPEIGGSSANDLTKELDLVGYVKMLGTDRYIHFTPQEEFYAKNTCNLPARVKINPILDEAGTPTAANDYLTRMIAFYGQQQEKRRLETAEYDQLIESVENALGDISDLAGINSLCDTLESPTLKHIFDSKIKTAAMVKARAEKLGAKYNSMTRRYEAQL